jgi:hypothetical protein
MGFFKERLMEHWKHREEKNKAFRKEVQEMLSLGLSQEEAYRAASKKLLNEHLLTIKKG